MKKDIKELSEIPVKSVEKVEEQVRPAMNVISFFFFFSRLLFTFALARGSWARLLDLAVIAHVLWPTHRRQQKTPAK